jgi:LacI family transcriptional regulator
MLTPKTRRIALLSNGNKVFEREVIAGVAAYLAGTRAEWHLFLEEDFGPGLAGIDAWQGDGIIAHTNDPAVLARLAGSRIPLVAVGGSYEDEAAYPAGLPYVASDNAALVRLAYEHLIETGLRHFAMFSLPEAPQHRWARERENAFAALLRRDCMEPAIFRGRPGQAPDWDAALREQVAWLHSLPKPVGIIAVNDGRARQLMQACALAGIAVPGQVALIGIDNDPLARMLTRIPISSVIQGAQEMGRTAAQLLDRMLHGVRMGGTRVLVAPGGISAQASSRHEPACNPHVMRARHFIRQYACQGIKTDQVADYVGISRSSLESHFRQALGCSVHDEILRFRLDAATAILAQGDCKLAEVALKCGFTSSQYMHSVFKRELGCSPRGWQERKLQHRRQPHGTASNAYSMSELA